MRNMVIICVVIFVVIVTSVNCNKSEGTVLSDKIFFWEWDKIYLATIKDNSASLEPFLLGEIDYVKGISVDGNLLSVVGQYRSGSTKDIKLSIILSDKKFIDRRKLVETRPLLSHSISIGGKYIAYVTSLPKSERHSNAGMAGYDICLVNVKLGKISTLVLDRVEYYSSLSWHSNSKELYYSSAAGIIESIDIASKKITSITEGHMPAWSPSEKKLAYYKNDKRIYIYDARKNKTEKIYSRNAFQTPITGHLFWSPDGKYLVFNVHSGLTGKGFECIMLDVETKNKFTIYDDGKYRCGPWMTTTSSAVNEN